MPLAFPPGPAPGFADERGASGAGKWATMGMALARGTLRGRALLTGSLAVALVAGTGAPILAGSARAQETASAFSTLAAAPEDAVAYFNIPLAEDSAQWTQAQALIERAGLGAALAEAQAEMGAEDLPLDAFLGGEAGVVVTGEAVANAIEAGNEAAGDGLMGGMDDGSETGAADVPSTEPQGWAVALDARAPDTAYAGLQAAVEGQADDAGVSVTEVEYEGVTITAAPPVPDADEDSDDMGLAVARVDDLVLIATVPADLEPLIDAAQGTVATLADVEEFSAVEAALPAEFLVFGYVNTAAATEAQAGETLGGDMGLPDFTTMQPPSVTGFTIAADEPGFRMETVTVGADGAALPAGQPNFESELVGKAPEDALFFLGASNLAATKVLDTVGALGIALALGMNGMAEPTTPTADQSLDDWVSAQYESLAGLLGINLQTDLFQQLTGEYGIWMRGGADPSTISALFASGVTDPATVAGALDQINLLVQGAGGGESFVTPRAVGDGSVSTIELGPGAPAFEYGTVGDELLIGVGDAVDVHAAATGEGLAGNAQFQDVMATLPAEHNSTFYVDLAQAIPLVQALSAVSDDMGMGMSAISDADPSCANYATAEEAQAAYDGFEAGTENLDADFDGQVCEDFFAPAAAETGDDAGDAADDDFAAFDASALLAFASVGFEEDGMQRSSSILYIAE